MIVTFKTRAYPDITMFGDVAVSLLKLMGLTGSVPGALSAEDVEPALERLRRALDSGAADAMTSSDSAAGARDRAAPESPEDDDDEEPAVSLGKRAFPLLELLTAAHEQRCHVMWESG